jgi:hypothetical protein
MAAIGERLVFAETGPALRSHAKIGILKDFNPGVINGAFRLNHRRVNYARLFADITKD